MNHTVRRCGSRRHSSALQLSLWLNQPTDARRYVFKLILAVSHERGHQIKSPLVLPLSVLKRVHQDLPRPWKDAREPFRRRVFLVDKDTAATNQRISLAIVGSSRDMLEMTAEAG